MLNTINNSDIYTTDALYYRPGLASIHLIRSGERIAIVDTGTQYSITQVNRSLTDLGLSYEHVDYIILTHIHLDHAGGASALMKLCTHAKLVVHPKGAPHMADPSKLIAGTVAVYGDEKFTELYGNISPIDEARIIQPADGETIDFNGRLLTFIATPGHANHHHCIIDEQSQSIFTGDTMGVSYHDLRGKDQAHVMISTTPVQFNPEAMHQSIDKVMSHKPRMLYLTHYGELSPNAKVIAGLHEQIDDYVMLAEQAADGDDFEIDLFNSLSEYAVRRCLNDLPQLNEQSARDIISLDTRLNAQGLAFWWQHRRAG